MEIKEFIEKTVEELDLRHFETLKGRLLGEYLTFSFVEEENISREVFCEKLMDYFEKIEYKVSYSFANMLSKYVDNIDSVVVRYVPKEPQVKKGKPVPPMPRSTKYYKHATMIKESRNLTIKQVTDFSRIMLCLYMGALNAGLKETEKFEFSTAELDIDKIISALKSEKAGRGLSGGKKKRFNLGDLYSTDTATFIVLMIMYFSIKNNELEGDY